jgi:hypothetical protein
MAAMEPLLAVEAMRNLHGAVLAVTAVGAVIAGLVYAVRSRKRSAGQSERDRGRGE